MPMHNMMEYDENYSKLSGSLWQYHRHESDDDDMIDSAFFKFKRKKTEKTPANGNAKNVEIAVPLKCLYDFWGNLEMPLSNCEINLILTWSTNTVITDSTDKKLYLPVATLYIQNNAKLLEQSKSGYKRICNSNKCQSKQSTEPENQCLGLLIDPSFQRVNRLFGLSFENATDRTGYTGYYLTKAKVQ